MAEGEARQAKRVKREGWVRRLLRVRCLELLYGGPEGGMLDILK